MATRLDFADDVMVFVTIQLKGKCIRIIMSPSFLAVLVKGMTRKQRNEVPQQNHGTSMQRTLEINRPLFHETNLRPITCTVHELQSCPCEY
ncbi:hypothetical protein E2C01_079411 [Portunus trituberculatus]|uniref:Uncharacterized protein n=1 Tax=Portunus trituberculatus TaxID=210409 RepID=A0A5B7ISP8_PORTR|nr:hypothetical protein [Portunus trituberculatus]